jgi:hypothetical protein
VARAGKGEELADLMWRSQADLDASLERLEGDEQVVRVRALVADGGMIELDPLGGKGPI